MGGMVAQELRGAASRRDGARLTLSARARPLAGRTANGSSAFVRQRLAPLEAGKTMAELAPKLVARLIGPAADEAGIAHRAAQHGAACRQRPSAAAVRLLVTFDRRDALAPSRCPTLVLAGERDRNAPPAMMRAHGRAHPAAPSIACLPDVGHLAISKRRGVQRGAAAVPGTAIQRLTS